MSKPKSQKKALIIGAGPAGLTAALELLKKTEYTPHVFESCDQVGGLSKTIVYKGNRMDLGGHRFFSKSDRIMEWWRSILPLETEVETSNIKKMLLRNRLSRIYYSAKFFDYPVTLTLKTLKNLGVIKTFKIGFDYLRVKVFPIKKEQNLEDFFINRFGKELYNTFFKGYTTKVWGKEPKELSADWGAQRVKGLSITKVVTEAVKKVVIKDNDYKQKNVETSLIEKFLYPFHGPGQLWEEVELRVKQLGGIVSLNHDVTKLYWDAKRITGVDILNKGTGRITKVTADVYFSTMPIKNLVEGLYPSVPEYIGEIASNLEYRDFLTVGILLDIGDYENIKDNWIYIHEPRVSVGRIQFYNNWSPGLVNNSKHIWLGMEYFCDEGDALWELRDREIIETAFSELKTIGLAKDGKLIDANVVRVPKAYPTYAGSYKKINTVREFLDKFENLYLLGRNGMHKYNNQDHSMLTAITAVENLSKGVISKSNIWEVNVEKDYHEEKTS